MGKHYLIVFLSAIIMTAFISCSGPTSGIEYEDVTNGETIEVGSDTKSIDLSGLSSGEDIYLRMNPDGTLNLSGVTLDSLYIVECEEADGDKGAKASGNLLISPVDSKWSGNGPSLLIPQVSGEVSFTGTDLGLSLEDGLLHLKKVGDDLDEASDKPYIEFKIHETTEFKGKPDVEQYLWPTYHNYIHIDFNEPRWSKFKDQKVVIMQNAMHFSPKNMSHGGHYSDNFGLLEHGKVIYGSSIQGLYDLSQCENDTLNLYSYLRTKYYQGSDERFRTYILLPEDVSETPLDIIGYPHVFKFDPKEGVAYEIRITDIPGSVFRNVLTNIIQGHPRYTGAGKKKNGRFVNEIMRIMNFSVDGDKYSVSLFFNEIGEEFIINEYWRDKTEVENFGKISLVESDWNESTDESRVNIDLNDKDTVTLGGEKPLIYALHFSIPKGKTYVLEMSTDDFLYAFDYTNRYVGSWEISKEQGTSYRTMEPGEEGYVTVCAPQGCTFSYELKEQTEN